MSDKNMRIEFYVTLPSALRVGSSLSPVKEAAGLEPIVYVLRALAQVNGWHHRTGDYVPLFRSGVKYVAEAPGREEWKDVPKLYSDRHGDCEDLACAYAGELQAGKGLILRGGRYVWQRHPISALPAIRWKRFSQGLLIHVVTLFPDGSTIDPSVLLGMKGSY